LPSVRSAAPKPFLHRTLYEARTTSAFQGVSGKIMVNATEIDPSKKGSIRALEATNFFLGHAQTGFGPNKNGKKW
jgi:hypothetical protein